MFIMANAGGFYPDSPNSLESMALEKFFQCAVSKATPETVDCIRDLIDQHFSGAMKKTVRYYLTYYILYNQDFINFGISAGKVVLRSVTVCSTTLQLSLTRISLPFWTLPWMRTSRA